MQDLPNGFTGFANKAKEHTENPLDALLRAEQGKSKEAEAAAPTPTLTKEQVQAIAEYDRRWSWVEVDRSAIQYNVLQTKKQLGSNCRLLDRRSCLECRTRTRREAEELHARMCLRMYPDRR